MRASMLEVSGLDYVRTARAKGISERRVIYGHALRNALLPLLTVVGVQLGSLLGLLPGAAYRALADEHWTALFVSKGIEDLTGDPPDEFTSRRLSYNDIMLSEDRSATREAVLTALRERRMYDIEYRIRHKDGSAR